MSVFLLPLVNIPQRFEIALAGVNYNLTVKWNDAFEGGWVMDIADFDTNTPIVANIALVVGVNLLDGLGYLGLGGSLYVYTDGDELSVPTYENLGYESNVYFVTEEAA